MRNYYYTSRLDYVVCTHTSSASAAARTVCPRSTKHLLGGRYAQLEFSRPKLSHSPTTASWQAQLYALSGTSFTATHHVARATPHEVGCTRCLFQPPHCFIFISVRVVVARQAIWIPLPRQPVCTTMCFISYPNTASASQLLTRKKAG